MQYTTLKRKIQSSPFSDKVKEEMLQKIDGKDEVFCEEVLKNFGAFVQLFVNTRFKLYSRE